MRPANHPLSWYIDKFQKGETFSMGMYGDGEWQAIFKHATKERFEKNCEGTVYTPELSQKMYESLFFPAEDFYFSVPDMLWTHPELRHYGPAIEKLMPPTAKLVEKNMWNEAMWKGELYPLIKELREHNLVIVSNKMLRGLTFLKYDHFIEVSYPNCFPELEGVVQKCLDYGKPGIYLFACGIPATLFTQALHSRIKDSWFIDLGSIWDGFVGIGGQRPTRRDFYLHPNTWKDWRDKNLQDIAWEQKELPLVEWYGMGSKDINGQGG